MEKGIDPEYEIWKQDMAKSEFKYVNSLFDSLDRNIKWAEKDIAWLEEAIRKWHKRIQDKT